MRSLRPISVSTLLAAALLLGGCLAPSSPPTADPAQAVVVLPAAHAIHPAIAQERARLTAHLARVEDELRAADDAHLTAAQREARRHHLAVLREYRERGLFPRNLDHPGERIPYFVDAAGTHCAVAYLIARSGGGDLVRRIARERNHAYVADLADEPEVLAWLSDAGLTVAEAGRIQPGYDYFDPWPGEPTSAGVSSAVILAVAGTSAGGAGALLNLPRWERAPYATARGVSGMAAGAAGVGLGIYALNEGSGAARLAGTWSVGVGAVSAALGGRTLLRRPIADGRAEVAVIPTVHPDGRAGTEVRIGF